jgi:hypothetical protein
MAVLPVITAESVSLRRAIDGTTMQMLFSSDPNDPDMKQGGKYNHPVSRAGLFSQAPIASPPGV